MNNFIFKIPKNERIALKIQGYCALAVGLEGNPTALAGEIVTLHYESPPKDNESLPESHFIKVRCVAAFKPSTIAAQYLLIFKRIDKWWIIFLKKLYRYGKEIHKRLSKQRK